MSNPHLPAEMLDIVVDHLHDAKDELESCCLVSKSWVSRARKHLFAHVAFQSPERLQSWKTTFPDPSTSPARHTNSLFVKLPQTVTPADSEEGGWIPTFSRVVRLEISVDRTCGFESLSLFHGFSPVIRSLRISPTPFPSSHFLNLICSFPLLEDLAVNDWRFIDYEGVSNIQPTFIQPSKPPALTGSLELSLATGMGSIAPILLSFPSGPHFKRLDLMWSCDEDMSLTAALVERCHLTLECLSASFWLRRPTPRPIDLSKATELNEMTLPCKLHPEIGPQWIVTTLQTITHNHKHFRQITLQIVDLDHSVPADPTRREWSELDRSFFRLWESHSIRLEVLYREYAVENGVRMRLESLLPEVTKGGVVDLILRN